MIINEDILKLSENQKQRLQSLIRGVEQNPPVTFFNPEQTEERYIPVEDGEVRCFHHTPAVFAGVRPIVFLPGWGTHPDGFADFFSAVNGRIECFYLETREKNSSRLERSRASLDMDQHARDIRDALRALGLTGTRDFVLMGTCWGSTMIAHGLARDIIEAPSVVLFDPMHRLWFSRWILKYIVPVTPPWFWGFIRPAAKRIAMRGMQEKTQRQRLESFIDNASVWKWRRAALQARDFELYHEVTDIHQEVFVMNGVLDHIHDNSHYPKLAALMPKGRFFYLQVDESRREYLMGMAAMEFAGTTAAEGPPAVLREFEKRIR